MSEKISLDSSEKIYVLYFPVFRIIFFSLSMQEVEKGNVGLSIICES